MAPAAGGRKRARPSEEAKAALAALMARDEGGRKRAAPSEGAGGAPGAKAALAALDAAALGAGAPSRFSRQANVYSRLDHHEALEARPRGTCASVLDAIGNTPLVRLRNIEKAEGLACEVYAKCEFLNAGGSVKDRIAKRMVEDAEAKGLLQPGDTIIEPTSGNTGIGLALAAAVKGYHCIVVMPEKMSKEKADVLNALGAKIVRTPNEAAWDAPDSHISVAARLNSETPRSHILDQYTNVGNPLAHYDGTGAEILEQMDNRIDVLVAGAGTGGTLTGTARRVLEGCPNARVVGVDPLGSILALPESLNTSEENVSQGMYQVEGIGYDFIPAVLDREVAHEWVKCNDEQAFRWARRLMREEGLLCGGSSGAAFSVAIREARKLKAGERLVVVLPDSIRNYMTKHLDDDWMVEKGFMQASAVGDRSQPWAANTVSELALESPVTISPGIALRRAVEIMNAKGFDQLPVVDVGGRVMGVVTEGNISAKVTSGAASLDDPVETIVYKDVARVLSSTTLAELSRKFNRYHFALVTRNQTRYSNAGEEIHTMVTAVVTRIDLLKFISAKAQHGRTANGVATDVAPCA